MRARNGSKPVLIDTNIFLRTLVKENVRMFEECQDILKQVADGNLIAYTNMIVVMEVQFVLVSVYHETRTRIKEAIEAIITTPQLRIIDDCNIHLALSFYGSTTVKFTDCLIASSQLVQSGGVVCSYDRDFDRLGVRRIEPGDLLRKMKK